MLLSAIRPWTDSNESGASVMVPVNTGDIMAVSYVCWATVWTNAVVAIWLESSYTSYTMGAVGVPINAGESSLAYALKYLEI